MGDGELVVTSGDDGRLRLFNYPCVVDDAPCRYVGVKGAVLAYRLVMLRATGKHDTFKTGAWLARGTVWFRCTLHWSWGVTGP